MANDTVNKGFSISYDNNTELDPVLSASANIIFDS